MIFFNEAARFHVRYFVFTGRERMWRNSNSFSAEQDGFDRPMRHWSVSNDSFSNRTWLFRTFIKVWKLERIFGRDEAERLGRALGCKLLRTSVKEDVGVMGVFRHLASRCLYEMRRYEEEEDFRIYSCGPRSPSVISELLFAFAWIFSFFNAYGY